MKKVALHNLGCKVNAYETEAMQEILEKNGYEIVPFKEGADIYIINTCTVTNMADRKSRQMLHRARKKNPDAIIVAAGCYVQAAEEAVKEDTAIDLVIGNNCKGQIVSMVEEFMRGREKRIQTIDINHTCDYEVMSISKVSEHTRAYIKIQDGCNQFCSYCIIPYARGRVRSRQAEDILAEVTTLAASGYREIVLTGIHVSSYGKDFEDGVGFGKTDALIRLVEALANIPGVERIRFGSLEPGIITEPFVKRLAALPQICPHFHLSLQSGCDATLKRMNRHYTAAMYAEKCDLLKQYFDRPAFTTDVIVGFPGETDEEFEATEKFLDDVHFAEMHVFKYSPRKGTRAAVMPDQVNESVKTARSNRLIALGERMMADYRTLCQDKTLEVLVEEDILVDGKTMWVGHSREYLKCVFEADHVQSKDVVSCKMTGRFGEDFVFCEIID